MLIFYRAVRAIAFLRDEQQLLQQPEVCAGDDGIAGLMESATERTVQHPSWKFESTSAFRFFQSAADDRTVAGVHAFRDNDAATIPRVPRVTDFTDVATVGILSPGCTTL